MSKNVTLVSKDGETEVVLDDPTEITQYKALGFAEKADKAAVEKKAEPAK